MPETETCIWMVERVRDPTPPADMHPDEYTEWYEYLADMPRTEIVECGAPVHDIEDGWECEAGHHHFTYGSARQQAEEQEMAMMERLGYYD